MPRLDRISCPSNGFGAGDATSASSPVPSSGFGAGGKKGRARSRCHAKSFAAPSGRVVVADHRKYSLESKLADRAALDRSTSMTLFDKEDLPSVLAASLSSEVRYCISSDSDDRDSISPDPMLNVIGESPVDRYCIAAMMALTASE